MRLIDADKLEYHGGVDCPQWITREEIENAPELKLVGLKIYKDSTLMGQTKSWLIQLIRCLEHNYLVAEERCNNQAALLEELMGTRND